MRMSRGVVLSVMVWLVGTACSNQSSTHLTPVVNGGSAGEAGSGGAAGAGAASEGGQAGSMDGGIDAGGARFHALMQGDTIELTPLDPVWLVGCIAYNPRVIHQIDGVWTPLQDDRVLLGALNFDSYYLDGAYKADACAIGPDCDVPYCYQYGQNTEPLSLPLVAREFVKLGEREGAGCGDLDAGEQIAAATGLASGVELAAGPEDAGPVGPHLVADIQSRTPSGLLGVRIVWYRDSRCADGDARPITTDVPVE